MKVTITKQITVDITQQDITAYRNENKGSMTGHLRRDENVAKLIALDRAWVEMNKLNPMVKTTTTLDDDADF